MKVRDLRLEIESLLRARTASPQLVKYLEILSHHDDMNIDEFMRRLSAEPNPSSAMSSSARSTASSIVVRLQAVFDDDQAFDDELDHISRQRSVTKLVLAQVFYDLFERTRGVPKGATRAELLRLIGDERRIIVRNERMGKMLGRRVVPAE